MTRRDDLVRLRDAVQAGDIGVTGPGSFRAIPKRGGGVYSDPNWYDAGSAYWQGSLDAAKSLHDAVLPSVNQYTIDEGPSGCGCHIVVWPSGLSGDLQLEFKGYDVTPARAWLGAILSALIAQEDAAQDRGMGE